MGDRVQSHFAGASKYFVLVTKRLVIGTFTVTFCWGDGPKIGSCNDSDSDRNEQLFAHKRLVPANLVTVTKCSTNEGSCNGVALYHHGPRLLESEPAMRAARVSYQHS